MASFVKTILPASYGYSDPAAALVDVHSRGVDKAWLTKRAAAGVFQDLDIKPKAGRAYIHLVAMGDAEYYGLNRNGDGFLKKGQWIQIPNPHDGKTARVRINKGNIDTFDTFEKCAKVYRNHVNKDPKKAHGEVYKAAHNDPMSRVELIIDVPEATWGAELEKLASGGDVPFSMSCKVPYDVCTECGHMAKNRSEYCDHAKNHMGEITKAGNQIGVMNDHMMFFDISKVVVPADRIAFGLLKAASDDSRVVSGAELSDQLTLFPPVGPADIYGLPTLDKLATIGKLADIEKEIEAMAPGSNNPLNKCVMSFDPDTYQKELNDDEHTGMRVPSNEKPNMLGALADAKISLSLKDFLKIILGRRYDEVENHLGEAENMLPGIFGRIMENPYGMMSNLDDFTLGNGVVPCRARKMIGKLIGGQSLADEPAQRRVTITVIRGKSPLKLLKPNELEKASGEASPVAERMAMAYAMYKVAFCQRVGIDDRALVERAVMQHYV